jgi:ABC-2 type transport system permease protein
MPADSAYPPGGLTAQAAGGVIHDRGYRRYDGPRLGRAQIVRALCWHSLRSAFGIGRGAKAKIVPVIAFTAMCLPAIVNAVAVARGGAPVVFYGTYTFPLRVVVMTVFVAVQAPELVSRDLRSRVLPLYFSRPLRRPDYPAAKYAAFTLACLVMIEIPLILLYLGTIVSAKGGSGVWSQTRLLAGGLGVGALWAVLLAAIGLALASLSAKRAYATGAIAIFFFLTWTLAQIIYSVAGHGGLAHPGPVPAGSGGHLQFHPALPVPGTGQRLSGLISPFTVIDGVRQWLGGKVAGPMAAPGGYGAAYGVMFLVLLAASLAILAARYRKAGTE